MDWKRHQDRIIEFVIHYGFALVGAVVIITVGAILALWIGRFADRWLGKTQLHIPLRKLLVRLLRIGIIGVAVMLALDKLGVAITPLVAGLGVAGVGIGLAAQGVLSNLVAGLTIILSKPFDVGEWIVIIGEEGQVEEIGLFNTILIQRDKARVLIPNRKIVGEVVRNYAQVRHINLTVGVAYGTDLELAMRICLGVLNRNTRLMKDPAPAVALIALADSSINLSLRAWVPMAELGVAQTEIFQGVVNAFEEAGISIPFPQRDIHIITGSQPALPSTPA